MQEDRSGHAFSYPEITLPLASEDSLPAPFIPETPLPRTDEGEQARAVEPPSASLSPATPLPSSMAQARITRPLARVTHTTQPLTSFLHNTQALRGFLARVTHTTQPLTPLAAKARITKPLALLEPEPHGSSTAKIPVVSLALAGAERPGRTVAMFDDAPSEELPVPAVAAAPIPAVPAAVSADKQPTFLPLARSMGGLQLSYGHARQHQLRHAYRLQYFSRKHLRQARVRDRRESRRLWTTIWSTTSSFFLLFLVIGGLIGFVAYSFINKTQNSYATQVLTLRDLLPPDNLKMYSGQGTLIDQLTDQGIHTEVKYDQIAPPLINATVAIEDRTFWSNSGVDLQGILRSALADLQSGQPLEGGSTITQQLVKLLVVSNSSNIVRKLSEIVLAPQVTQRYSKSDIMEMYLNTIYYGYQAYGIDAAATVYFGLQDKPDHSAASQLDLAQAALLAGLPRNASLYDPFVHPQTATTRFYSVLEAMVAQGTISQLQAQAAYQEEQAPSFFKSSPTLQDQAPHFDEYVLSQLEQMFHLKRSQLSRSGLIVSTTVNLTLQKGIQEIMQQHVAEIRAAHHVTNAAEVLIDFHTGAILSMLGSIDYYNKSIDGQYNVALAYRQPGSSFKPYVYVTAFAQGASPAQAIDDAPTTFANPGGDPPLYSPSNYDLHFHGHMTLRCALQNSLNVPAVRVLQHVGINSAMATAKAMGITSYEGTPGLSLVLGGLDVRLLDHTSAIGVFANGGVRQPSFAISKVVQGTSGKVLFQHQSKSGARVITPQLAYMMTNTLSDNASRIPEFFDCNVLQLYANSQQSCYEGDRGQVRPAAAKTGTTQDFRDNWTVGYTTDYVMGVWAGNDDNSQMIDVTGVQGAAPIWHDAMLLAEQGHPIRDFHNPGGLVRATATYPDGVKATDWFLPGTVPAFQPTPTPVVDGTPPPFPIHDKKGPPPQPTPATYCGSYSFAFPPPPGSGIPIDGGWW